MRPIVDAMTLLIQFLILTPITLAIALTMTHHTTPAITMDLMMAIAMATQVDMIPDIFMVAVTT